MRVVAAFVMGVEIERRYLVLEKPPFLLRLDSLDIEQWYAPDFAGLIPPDDIDMNSVHEGVRIRRRDKEWLATLKGPWNGISRIEEEWKIPKMDCPIEWPHIHKTRYLWPDSGGLVWEIDVFHGPLEGLVIAEIELPEENHFFTIPKWAAGEITAEPGWSNVELAVSNYSDIMQSIVMFSEEE